MSLGRSVLLTGATGALGPALAAELLAGDHQPLLHVLIRDGAISAAERFGDWLDAVDAVMHERAVVPPSWRDRVRLVAGDVRSDNLGFDVDSAAYLGKNLDTIIHAAADTQFMNDHADQWQTNVEGTRHVLDFAQRCKASPRLVIVSTICTSGLRVGRIEECFDPVPPEFGNNYERTKWESERLAVESGLELAIARVSIVLGSHASGRVHRDGAFHQMHRWHARGLLPVIPGYPNSPFDLIATETASRFIAAASARDWNRGDIWHVAAGDRAATLGEMAEIAFEQNRPGEPVQNLESPGDPFIVDPRAFEEFRQSKSAPRQRVVRQVLDAIHSFLPGLIGSRRYDTTQAEKLWGGELPLCDWRTTLRRVIRFGAQSATYMRRARRPVVAQSA